MELIIFKGSVDEFKQVGHLFPSLNPALQDGVAEVVKGGEPESAPVLPTTAPSTNGKRQLTVVEAEALLTRRALSKMQAAVIRALHQAGESGMTSAQLAEDLQMDREKVKAIMRSFGKRVAHTEGWPKELNIFQQRWDGQQNHYRLHKAMSQLLDSQPHLVSQP